MAKKKNLTQTESNSQTPSVAASKKQAYYQSGEALKANSPAFARYIGVMQKMYAGIPYWVLTILMTVLTVLQVLDVFSMASAASAYGVLQAIPLLFALLTTVLMWITVFHAKKKSDHYYPIKGMLGKILLCFVLFIVSSLAVSFVTSGFGAYLSQAMEQIGKTSLKDVMADVAAKFEDALNTGASIGNVTFDANSSKLNSATSSITDSKLETLGMGVILGIIVMVIAILVRSIQVLKAIAASRNSVEYEEKVGDARITGKQILIYGIFGVVVALLVYLLDPMLASMKFVSTGFNFFYESMAELSFSDGQSLEFMYLSEIPEYQVVLAVPLILVALLGLVVFALVQIYRYIVLSGVFAKINASTKTGVVPKLPLAVSGVIGIVLAIFMMTNAVTWSMAFFFARLGGISVLTAIGKVMLIAVVILICSVIMLQNNNELKICYETQCKEMKKEIPAKTSKFRWTPVTALIATAGCVLAWLGACWLMNKLDLAGNVTLQVFSVMGSYDADLFGSSLMNEILYTLIQLRDQAMILISALNQMVLRGGLVVGAVAWMISRNRFYKSGFSPEATQKAGGISLILPKILLILFAVVSAVLTVAQLFIEGSWAGVLLTAITSAFDLTVLMGLTVFFLRKAKCGKAMKLFLPIVVGVVSKLAYTLIFEISLSDLLKLDNAAEQLISVIVVTLVFQLVRWLFANTYYLETNNLLPVVFYDFLLVMMMTITAGNMTGAVGKTLPELMFNEIKVLFEQLSNGGFKDNMTTIMPVLINLAVILLGLLAMLLIGVILLVRHLMNKELPGDGLSDIDHVEEDDGFMTEAERLEMEAEQAAAAAAAQA